MPFTTIMILRIGGFLICACFSMAVDTLTEGKSNNTFSSFRCIGGSQLLDTNSMKQAAFKSFPLNDPEHRTCLFRNVCFVNGTLTYYISERGKATTPAGFLPFAFENKMFHTGHLRGFTISMAESIGSLPLDIPFHHSKVTFLDANSWSFNWGHYMNDNVLTAFAASKVFNVPFSGTQQIIETNCRLFSSLDESFAHKLVDYNHSMGTYRQACLAKFDGLWENFFDNPPIYLDDYQTSTICFRKLFAGQGSTYGLKSLDLSRAIIWREFRDYVLSRIFPIPPPPQENLILVGLRVAGSAGGTIIGDLCGLVKNSLAGIPDKKDRYVVECILPSDMSMKEEITYAQRAKVIITVHGTISYLSMFSKEGTQQISIANPKELKENQMLLWATHFNTLFLTWDKMPQLTDLVSHALFLSESYFADES